MKIQLRKLKYMFKKKACIGLVLVIFVIIGAGCARSRHHRDSGPYLKIQGGQNSGGVTWSK
ncbi:MAG: hypothetical protein PHE58_00955 [Candidatus Omnitrophica bacterium]|nr:hypothetical protein [Candidatus Omnitrophota bacterium]